MTMANAKTWGHLALGATLGAILANTLPVLAAEPVIDVEAIEKDIGIYNTLQDANKIYTSMQSDIHDFLGPNGPIHDALGDSTYGTVQDLLQQGFTQNANYSKAQVGAMQQISDANNTVMAENARNLRNAQMRDEQTLSPTACTTLDGGVSTQAAAVQAFGVAAAVAQIHDARGEAQPGMPSYFGAAQGVASMNASHIAGYCDQIDDAAGLCPNGVSDTPDADQQYTTFYSTGVYPDQAGVNAAKDYATNLIEPVAPAAVRGTQLTSVQGQDYALRRRAFNARMSLAQYIADQQIGMQSPSIPLTKQQQQYLTNMGLPAATTGSWFQVLQIEAQRRVSDLTWHGSLQNMQPAAVQREIALELALNNYLAFLNFKTQLQHTTVSATQLAQTAEKDFEPTVEMPSPGIAAN